MRKKKRPKNKGKGKPNTAGRQTANIVDEPELSGWVNLLIPDESTIANALPEVDDNTDPATSAQILSNVFSLTFGRPGIYRVTFLLTIPGKTTYGDPDDVDRMMRSGDSLLKLEKGKQFSIEASDDSGEGPIVFSANQSGRLSSAQIRVKATTFIDAGRKAYNIVMSVLSFYSYQYDVSLDIGGYEIVEEATGSRGYLLGVIGRVKTLDFGRKDRGTFVSNALRPVVSTYREGLSSTNVFYKAMSFYKVIEACKHLKDERIAVVLASGQKPQDAGERFPESLEDLASSDPYTITAFEPYLGQNYSRILDKLRAPVRNAVAHLDPNQKVLIADNYDDLSTCERAVPILKYIARQMLTTELQTRQIINTVNGEETLQSPIA
jgi:Methylamine utilization protein MauJ